LKCAHELAVAARQSEALIRVREYAYGPREMNWRQSFTTLFHVLTASRIWRSRCKRSISALARSSACRSTSRSSSEEEEEEDGGGEETEGGGEGEREVAGEDAGEGIAPLAAFVTGKGGGGGAPEARGDGSGAALDAKDAR
jgi:hypothetical protein